MRQNRFNHSSYSNPFSYSLYPVLYPGKRINYVKQLREIIEKQEALKETFIVFNMKLSSYGWIATDDLDVFLMEKAIELFDSKGLGLAENFLCDYLSEEYLENTIKRMNAIWVFKDRETLIRLAAKDHLAGRYHASVPVIISQIDGLIHDIADQSFFRNGKGADVFQHKSRITGSKHSLDSLSKNMSTNRNTTTSNPITIPYRHGIMHGRDLNYNNKLVSAKCFYCLFAIRPWALFIQQNELLKLQGKEFVNIPNFKIGIRLKDYLNKLMEA